MNNTSVLSVAKNRVVWLDVVRFVAMFTVVCCHCADPFNFYSGEPSAELEQIKFWGAAYGAFLRRSCRKTPRFVTICSRQRCSSAIRIWNSSRWTMRPSSPRTIPCATGC